jgi:uncharacterized protein YuzE
VIKPETVMKLEHDSSADAVYIRLRGKPYDHGMDLDDSRRIDYGGDGLPIGIELLNVSLGVDLTDLPYAPEIAKLLAERGIRVSTSASL